MSNWTVRRFARRLAAAGLTATTLLGRPAAAQETEPATTLTLEEAVARALENHPLVVQAGGAVRTAEAAEKTAWGSYLPSISVNAGSSLASTERLNGATGTTVTGSSDHYSAGLSGSWQLYTGGRRGAERDQARAESVSAQATLTEQRFAVVLATERAFFEVLRARELGEVALARIQTAEEGLQAAQRRMDVGSATRSDVLRARLELNTARESLLQARNDERSASFQLGRLVGEDAAVGAAAIGPIEPRPLAVSAAELTDRVIGSAPTVHAARAALSAADAGVVAARAQYLPSLNLSTGYNWFNQDPVLAAGRTSWQLNLGVSLPVFNGFQREAGLERARVQEMVAEAQLRDARLNIGAEVERLLGNLRLAEERIALGVEAVEVADEDLRVQQDRYRLGASTILDLLASQTAVVQARTDLVGARYDYQLARAELEALAGAEL